MKKRYKLYVAGTQYYQDALASLMHNTNYEYSMTKKEMLEIFDETDKIYQYEIEDCALVIRHEPGNEYDPAALQVYADDVMIGYVPKGKLRELGIVARKPGLEMSVQIYGGKYKQLEHDDEADLMDEYTPKYFKVVTDADEYRAIMFFDYQQ